MDGEEPDSQKIIQGDLTQVPLQPAGPSAPQTRPGEGPGTEGGRLGQAAQQPVAPAQPVPAPDFIKQDPVEEDGTGSTLDITGEAQEVFENPEQDAPINVTRRPETLPEEVTPPGDGAGGSPDATPTPRARPRLAPELLTGPLMKSRGSAANRGSLSIDATFSEFGEYQQQFYAALQLGWYQEIEFFQPIDTASSVTVRFTMYSDGRIEDVKTVQSNACLLYTSPSPRDGATSRMPSSA